MKQGRFHLFFGLYLALCANIALGWDTTQQALQIAWPPHWQYRAPQRQGPAIHLQAREQNDGITQQTLDITVVDTRSAQKTITSESIKDLAGKLRDATLSTSVETSIPLHEFGNHRGYYFVASDAHFIAAKKDSFKQMVEGVVLLDKDLVNFTLLTNEAAADNARSIVAALGDMQIDETKESMPTRAAATAPASSN
jgi:hypothetical protein